VQAAGLAFAVGWLMFCAAYHFRELPEIKEFPQMASAYIVMPAVIGRLWIYLYGYVPPISVFGRIATGRLVIPGYDVVLVAPLTIGLVAGVLPRTLSAIGIAPLIAYPLAASVVTWLALALPPRREDWQLTGHHRIAFRFLAKRNSQAEANRRTLRTS
jgi:hypothetical protein